MGFGMNTLDGDFKVPGLDNLYRKDRPANTNPRFAVIAEIVKTMKHFARENHRFLRMAVLNLTFAMVIVSLGAPIYHIALVTLGIFAIGVYKYSQMKVPDSKNDLKEKEVRKEKIEFNPLTLKSLNKNRIRFRNLESAFRQQRIFDAVFLFDHYNLLYGHISKLKKDLEAAGITCPNISKLFESLSVKKPKDKNISNSLDYVEFLEESYEKLLQIYHTGEV